MPTIHNGDCIETMNQMPPESVDAIVTDPPYGLSNTTPAQVADAITKWAGGDRDHAPTGRGFMGKSWDAFVPPPAVWDACMRVLKPGGHMVVFAGSRTHDLMGLSIRLAGFEIRDSLAWLYGSGFPKSHDVGKAIDKLDASDERRARALEFTAYIRESGLTARRIDEITGTNMGGHFTTAASQPAVATAELFDLLRPHLPEVPERIEELVRQRTVESENYKRREVVGQRTTGIGTGRGAVAYISDSDDRDLTAAHTPEAQQWEGWGTALKPGHEPVVLARKPLAEKTVARNVLAHGTGAINIDGCRIEGEANRPTPSTSHGGSFLRDGCRTEAELRALAEAGEKTPYGRDARATLARYEANGARREEGGEKTTNTGRWPANVVLDQHAAAWVDEQSGDQKDGVAVRRNGGGRQFGSGLIYSNYTDGKNAPDLGYGGGGGASRFFYSAKAPKSERPNVDGVQHPTVKPLKIMQWLIRLVTPPGGVVLDPFAGSGTTIEAAIIEGFEPIGIEMEADYLPLIQHRIDRQAGTLPA